MKERTNGKKPASHVESGGARRLQPLATILHVDDDHNDSELLEAALLKANIDCVLCKAEDAEHAKAYLDGRHGSGRGHWPPSLILLDLKMPRTTGLELLRWIRSSPGLGTVPVVVLSGSELKEDKERARAAGANAYQVKPLEFRELVKLVQKIAAQWLPSEPGLHLGILHHAASKDGRSGISASTSA